MSEVLVIAEIGVNHNGDLEIAEKLIKSAAIAGANIVKFLTSRMSRNVELSTTSLCELIVHISLRPQLTDP